MTTPIYDQCVEALGVPGEHCRADDAELVMADVATAIPEIAGHDTPPRHNCTVDDYVRATMNALGIEGPPCP